MACYFRWNLAWTFSSSASRPRYVALRLRTGCYLCPRTQVKCALTHHRIYSFTSGTRIVPIRSCARGGLLFLVDRDDMFHACTLSTGAVHPLAEHGGSFPSWNGSWRFDPVNICVCGDYVAAATRAYFISVWNWKTGQFVSDQVRVLTNPVRDIIKS